MTNLNINKGKGQNNQSTVWMHRARLSNGSEFYGLQTTAPGLSKVIIRFEHPWLFAAENTLADFTFQLFKSGTTGKDTFAFVSSVEETGMMLSNSVTPDSGLVEFVVLDSQLDTVLPLVFDMIGNPAFPEDEFERVKTIGYENWRISRKRSHVLAREQFMKSLFGNRPYGKTTTGDEIKGYTIEDVKRIHSRIIQNIRPTIFSASFDPESTAKAIERSMQQHMPLSVKAGNGLTADEYMPGAGSQNGTTAHIAMQDTVQSSIRTGREMFTRDHPEYIIGRVATTLLGGYFSSRLMANLREDKGYTYGVGASLVTLASAGYFTISAEVGSAHLQSALEEIRKEIDRLRSEPVEEDELQTVKQYLRGSALRETDGAFNRLDLYAVLMRRGLEPEWMDSFIAGLELITQADILNFSQNWFNFDELKTITCGQAFDEEMKLKQQYNTKVL